MFRKARITVLIYALLLVFVATWLTRMRSTSWDEPLWVLLYPINADGSDVSATYIRGLQSTTFEPVQTFFADQARTHGVLLDRPFVVNLAPELSDLPPSPPDNISTLAVMWWSLKLRYYAWRVERNQLLPSANIQVFVLYHDPERRATLPHSLGLQEGLIGVVHAFASPRMTQSNNVVIAHEMLHTVGATDKYERTGFPIYPDGFADPARSPLYPQTMAELMAGRIPVAERRAMTPRSLKQVVIGPKTAEEVNWRVAP